MILEIKNYIKISNSIDEILKNSPFKMKYIIEKSGISEPTFFRKMKEKKFLPEELLKIAEIIEPEKISHDDILNAIQEGLDEKNGRITEHMAVMNEAKERIAKRKMNILDK
jgi:CCR4-NOT transcriptional regulation complex NOT5 subunit